MNRPASNLDYPFSDLALSRRLEAAEGNACSEYAQARKRIFPESGAKWMRCAGADVVFDGVTSPITQTFGLGLFEDLSVASLETIERFFLECGAPVFHEVSPFAGIPAQRMLCERRYRPVENTGILYQTVNRPADDPQVSIRVRIVAPNEVQLWSEINAQGWSHDHPEFQQFLLELGTIAAAREHSLCFLAEFEGRPGAAGALSIHEGVALFAGSATIPELRRRGLQAALLRERMRYAFEHGCDLAMMGALPGSNSQRNAERNGFRIAYTRTKWMLDGAG